MQGKSWINIMFLFLLTLGAAAESSHPAFNNAEELNAILAKAGASWTAGENWITQMAPEDRRILPGIPDLADRIPPDQIELIELGLFREEAPKGSRAYRDWRDHLGHDWVTSVKNQGQCGSCVAFGSIAAVECQLRINSGIWDYPIDLSESHLFSCGGGSCTYGWQIDSAYSRLVGSGTPDEACLPYQAVDTNCNQACADWRARAFKIQDYDELGSWFWPPSNEDIKTALHSGPVTCSMMVYTDFMYYSGGVYQHTTGEYEGGHAVCIVGYDDAQSCWIVKNSWGKNWGEEGFFRIVYGDSDIGRNSTVPVITFIPPTPTTLPATQTPVPSATPLPSVTPEIPTPTPDVPAATPTVPAGSDEPYLKLRINRPVFIKYDPMDLRLELHNPAAPFQIDLFVILDVGGHYWFWPQWTETPAWQTILMPDTNSAEIRLLEFTWPDLGFSLSGMGFWAAGITEGRMTVGYDFVSFRYQN